MEKMTGAHVQYEGREWYFMGHVVSELSDIGTWIAKWCRVDKGILLSALK